ncbi:non-ribosomal peptide synthetase [Pseudoalteromonas piscicida]|uniref:non-ribosomal peptide synthetase n=1 Tax=Pseudoalteromonas piscicida TaxID=43662 RepID=UPI003C7CE832
MRFDFSLAQKDVYFDQLHCIGNAKYNIGGYVDISSANVTSLLEASDQVIASNPMFSLTIEHEHDGPKARFDNALHIKSTVVDYRDAIEPIKSAQELVKEIFSQPFDLKGRCLYKTYIIQLTDQRIWFVGVAHHLLIDGWGFALWAEALSKAYESKEYQVNEHAQQNYFEQDSVYLESERYQKDKEFWKSYLHCSKRNILVPNRKLESKNSSERVVFSVARDKYESLFSNKGFLAKSPGTVFLSLVFIMFSRLYRERNFNVGLPAHNRKSAKQKNDIALYTSVSPISLAYTSDTSFDQFLSYVASEQKKIYRHQKYPIGHIVSDMGPEARSGLYDVCVNFLKLNNSCRFAKAHASYHYIENPFQTTPFNLTIWDNGEVQPVELQVDYHMGYFSKEEIAQLLEILFSLLEQVSNNPEVKLSELMLTSEKNKSLSLSDTGLDEEIQPFITLFLEQVRKSPNTVAVSCQNRELTYEALDLSSTRLALRFKEIGVKAGDLVGLMLHRSERMVEAIVALSKIGAGFVPMDPSYPVSRLKHMAHDSNISLLVIDSDFSELAFELTDKIYIVESLCENTAVEIGSTTVAKNDSTAYVIYTSGSTGTPKGVEISNLSLANFLLSMRKKPGISHGDRLLAVTPFSFDISILELLLPLISGATVKVFPSRITHDLQGLVDEINKPDTSIVQMTPSAWKLVLASGWQGKPSLKALVGGEALPQHLATELTSKVDALWNMYGPTETTIWSSCIRVEESWSVNSIGHPIANTQMAILDSQHNFMPVGWTGELYISGKGLAKGYFNQPELTASRFISCNGERWYNTGDLAKIQPDGSVEFVGRIDTQVKFQGYRIELGEIESILKKLPNISDAVVLIKTSDSGHQCLCAYYISENDELSSEHLRAAASEYLPLHMLPSHWQALKAFPLTPSGKLDSKSLSLPSSFAQVSTTENEDRLIQELAAVICHHLQIPHLDAETNFFDAGARSQEMVELVPKLNEALSLSLTVVDMFSYPSLNALAQVIDASATRNSEAKSRTEQLQSGKSRLQRRLNTRKQVNEY